MNDVDKIALDMARIDQIVMNNYQVQDNQENDLEIHSDSEDEKADILDDVVITKGNPNKDMNESNALKGNDNYNYKYNGKILNIDGMKYEDSKRSSFKI